MCRSLQVVLLQLVKRLLADQIELAAEGRAVELVGRRDEHLLDDRLAGGGGLADVGLLGVGRHAPPADEPLPLSFDVFLQVGLAEFPLFFIARQENLADGIAANLWQFGVETAAWPRTASARRESP